MFKFIYIKKLKKTNIVMVLKSMDVKTLNELYLKVIKNDNYEELIYAFKDILNSELVDIEEIKKIISKNNIKNIVSQYLNNSIPIHKIYLPHNILHDYNNTIIKNALSQCISFLTGTEHVKKYSNLCKHYALNCFNTELEKQFLNMETIQDCHFLMSQNVGDTDPLTIWKEDFI